ncbi:MAG: hypothetical protein QXV10_06145, partial [Nitrososphaerota archaeon]
MTCLSDKEILKKIMSENPLIKDYINLEEQIQPAGFDLTLNSVYSISSQGEIYDSSIKEDILPNYEEVKTIIVPLKEVKITILDRIGKPIENAKIRLVDKADINRIYESITNKDG